jgi:small subunit ribosomal protein S17
MQTATEKAVRSARPMQVGLVTSDKRDKTLSVTVDFQVRHAKYGKFMKRSTRYHVHDEKNEARVGDTVEITECRPLSRTKNWRLVRIVTRAPRGGEA